LGRIAAIGDRGRDRWRRLQERRWQRRQAGPRLIGAFARAYPEAAVVEIGANDGDRYDHIHSALLASRWQALLVEPVPYVFDRLRQNLGGLPRVRLANTAVADHDGEMTFYHLAPADGEDLPDWYDAIGSFSRDHVLAHRRVIHDIEDRVVATTVRCMTVASLLKAFDVDRVDLLVTDTEGYDHEILKQVDFEHRPPRMVIYEHYHLVGELRRHTRALLEAHGYALMEEGFDTFCIHPGEVELTRFLGRLKPGVPGLYVENEGS
jgi:FkbM family methyltransferase